MALKTARDAIANFLDTVVGMDADHAESIVGITKAFAALSPQLGTLTKLRKRVLSETFAEGEYVDSWGDFLSAHEQFDELSAEWKTILARAEAEFNAAAAASEEKTGGPDPRKHYATPKVTFEITSWDSTPGGCEAWFSKAEPILAQFNFHKTEWFQLLSQRISGTGREDWENCRRADPEASFETWRDKLIKLYDVDAEFLLLSEFKRLSTRRIFGELRTDIQRLTARLEKYGWKFDDKQKVMWAAVCMQSELW
jgi:hypothetical protein